eukprot:CAMPEP_0175626422 /NCGR_PEP_ID=MMETSP0096-20121207/70981_1 /TAXON_ID=311494 /ORGANISM="Alexandrium monilatum, Strain CCMP3105" /LENGTH=116 /DNA_ID=CAMNT_0016931799 /DNA_START=320 /DNA_END=666 /DNA_ORIENTATION=+
MAGKSTSARGRMSAGGATGAEAQQEERCGWHQEDCHRQEPQQAVPQALPPPPTAALRPALHAHRVPMPVGDQQRGQPRARGILLAQKTNCSLKLLLEGVVGPLQPQRSGRGLGPLA